MGLISSVGCVAYSVGWYIVCPKQLSDHTLKHGVPHKCHQLHLPSIAMATQAGMELRAEGVAQCAGAGRKSSLQGIVDGGVVSTEGGGGNTSWNNTMTHHMMGCVMSHVTSHDGMCDVMCYIT